MFKSEQRRSALWMSGGLAMGLLVGVGMVIGVFVATSSSEPARIELPDKLLHASATHGSDEFAIATGAVSEDTEGIFFLDFLTGELSCFVLYPRQGVFGGQFKINVVDHLGIQRGKNPKYVIVTGVTEFRG